MRALTETATVPKATTGRDASCATEAPTRGTLTSCKHAAKTVVTWQLGLHRSWLLRSSCSPLILGSTQQLTRARDQQLVPSYSGLFSAHSQSGEMRGCATRPRCWWASISASRQCRAPSTSYRHRASRSTAAGSTSSRCPQSLRTSSCQPLALATIAHASCWAPCGPLGLSVFLRQALCAGSTCNTTAKQLTSPSGGCAPRASPGCSTSCR
mmetsp:Transcript_15184/g.45542  ORF Transcript_15184/g.45542 Transcript_15184/m.45542 type:complete len:211 (-) Transcript_15184:303-935(-)